MMKKLTLSVRLVMVGLVLLFVYTSAQAQDIRYNFLPGTDFSQYKTYKWLRIEKVEYPNDIVDKQIMTAIDAQMALKGLTKTEENPDIYVMYQAAVSSEKQWNSYSTGGGGWGYGRWGGWGGMGGMETTTTTSSTIHTGTLNVDMYDVAKKEQVWRGEASKTLGSGKDPAKVQKNLNKAMEKLFKKYPPPVKS